ncbi:MAG TPA: dienelactone hydrolase family protein [Syntrophorhabdaceae bacterium]|nr:dienelactone hydrolase family protein [Syntrophorhabdaceae bacterium]
MDKRVFDLYDEYSRGLLDRRGFLKRLSLIAGGVVAANALFAMLEDRYAAADIVAKDDPRLSNEDITYQGATGDIRAKLSRPRKDGKVPGVVVIPENRGLNAHIADVTRRIALEGFLALAPDPLSPLGGTPEDESKAVSLIAQLDQQSTIKNYVAAVKYLKTHPMSTGKVGVVGFCWGGAMANQVAVNSPDVSAVVPYYGAQPASEDVPKIKASLLLHYAGLDQRINAGIPAYEAALKRASVDYKLYMYEGAQHGFNNDTNAERYSKEAAGLAWGRTIAFFKEKLKI